MNTSDPARDQFTQSSDIKPVGMSRNTMVMRSPTNRSPATRSSLQFGHSASPNPSVNEVEKQKK
jgi:hypothetical protein